MFSGTVLSSFSRLSRYSSYATPKNSSFLFLRKVLTNPFEPHQNILWVSRVPVLSSIFFSRLSRNFGSKIQAIDIRKGHIIKAKGRLMKVMKTQESAAGRRDTFLQVELTDIQKGVKLQERYRSGEQLEVVELDYEKIEYQGRSKDGSKFLFSKEDFGEEIELDENFLGFQVHYLEEGMQITLRSLDGKPIIFELPDKVEMEVVEVTAVSNGKKAVLKNGRVVKVPSHVDVGDIVLIRPSEETFISKI